MIIIRQARDAAGGGGGGDDDVDDDAHLRVTCQEFPARGRHFSRPELAKAAPTPTRSWELSSLMLLLAAVVVRPFDSSPSPSSSSSAPQPPPSKAVIHPAYRTTPDGPPDLFGHCFVMEKLRRLAPEAQPAGPTGRLLLLEPPPCLGIPNSKSTASGRTHPAYRAHDCIDCRRPLSAVSGGPLSPEGSRRGRYGRAVAARPGPLFNYSDYFPSRAGRRK